MERQSAVRFPKLLLWLAGREKARHDEGGVRIQQHATTTQGRCLRAKTLALHMLLVWWCGGGRSGGGMVPTTCDDDWFH